MEREHKEPRPALLQLSVTTNVSVGARVRQATSNQRSVAMRWEIIASICASCTKLVHGFLTQYRLAFWPKGCPLAIGCTLTPKPKHFRQAGGRGFTSPNRWRVPGPSKLEHLEQNKRALQCGTTAIVCCGTRQKHTRQSLRCMWQSRKICSPLRQLMSWHSKQEVKPIPFPFQSRWSMVGRQTGFINGNLKEKEMCCCSIPPQKGND